MDSISDRTRTVTIDVQRRRLFRAAAIAEMCRLACASKYDGFDPEQLADALWVVYELIEDVAGTLHGIADEESARVLETELP